MKLNQILHGDWIERMKEMPSESVDLCFTSPPYWRRRQYSGLPGELGQEPTVREHIMALVSGFAECQRLLKPTGSLIVNYGDVIGDDILGDLHKSGIPYRLRIAINDYLGMISVGDYPWVREDGFPAKGNPRRFGRKHEMVLHFAKSEEWYFDIEDVRVPLLTPPEKRLGPRERPAISRLLEDVEPVDPRLSDKTIRLAGKYDASGGTRVEGIVDKRTFKWNDAGRIPGDVFVVNGSDGVEHPAPFPQALVRPFVRSCSPKGGVVLDPFSGSGTTALTAAEEGRSFIGIEFSEEYVELSRKRLGHWLDLRRGSLEVA